MATGVSRVNRASHDGVKFTWTSQFSQFVGRGRVRFRSFQWASNRMSSKSVWLLCGVTLFVQLAGCSGDGPDLVEVQGTVKLDGKPLPEAKITFQPEGGAGTYSGDLTDENGRYRLHYSRTRRGAMIATHRVEITTAIGAFNSAGEYMNKPELVPPQYNTRSELRSEVTPKPNPNRFDFNLESGGFPEKKAGRSRQAK